MKVNEKSSQYQTFSHIIFRISQDLLPKYIIIHQLNNADKILIFIQYFFKIIPEPNQFRRGHFSPEYRFLKMGQILFTDFKHLLHSFFIYIVKYKSIVVIHLLFHLHLLLQTKWPEFLILPNKFNQLIAIQFNGSSIRYLSF